MTMKLFLLVAAITGLAYAGEHDNLFLTPESVFYRLDTDDAVRFRPCAP